MMEIYDLICGYIAIWIPSIAAILGIIYGLIKFKSTMNELKQDELIKQYRADIQSLRTALTESTRTNKLLLDKITKIEGYAETKK